MVTNSAPVMSTNPTDQSVAMNAHGNYVLPSYSDPEGNPITLSIIPALSFVSISGSTI